MQEPKQIVQCFMRAFVNTILYNPLQVPIVRNSDAPRAPQHHLGLSASRFRSLQMARHRSYGREDLANLYVPKVASNSSTSPRKSQNTLHSAGHLQGGTRRLMPSETPEPLAGSGVKSVLDVATIEVLLLLTLNHMVEIRQQHSCI